MCCEILYFRNTFRPAKYWNCWCVTEKRLLSQGHLTVLFWSWLSITGWVRIIRFMWKDIISSSSGVGTGFPHVCRSNSPYIPTLTPPKTSKFICDALDITRTMFVHSRHLCMRSMVSLLYRIWDKKSPGSNMSPNLITKRCR
jgi:hypothetical protein